jgi:tetratricopeptide (TPR) repeat protein
MAKTRRPVAWAAAVAFGLATLGLGIYLVLLGIGQALAVATLVGAFAGVIGLAVSVFGLIASRHDPASPALRQDIRQSRIGAIINIGRAQKSSPRSTAVATPASAPDLAVTNSKIGANIDVAAGGNVAIEVRQGGEPGYRLEAFPLEVPPVPPDSHEQPSRLLGARYRIVKFSGRADDLQKLADWLDGPGPGFAVRLLHGPGGEGKTRLAAEFAKRSAAAGWAVAQVSNRTYEGTDEGLEEFTPGADQKLLLIVDYAERWPLTDLLSMLDDRALRSATGLRALLLARSSGEWWESFRYNLTENGVAADQQPLSSLADSLDTRFTTFRDARDRFAEILEVPHPEGIEPPVGMFADDAFRKVLTIHMTALAAVHARQRGETAPADPIAVSEYLLEREQEYWRRLYRGSDEFKTRPEVMGRAVYTAILTRPLPFDIAIGVLERAGIAAAPEAASQILDDHAVCYPPTTPAVLEPLYPDRLAEDFIALRTPGRPATAGADRWAASAVAKLLAIDEGQPIPDWARQAMTVLIEASRRWDHLAAQQLFPLVRQRPWLAVAAGAQALSALAAAPDVSLDVLQAVEAALPDGRRVDLDVGIAAVTARVAGILLPRTADDAVRGDIYRNLGMRQANAGLFDDAVESCEQAVRAYENLPPTERPELGLARALDELGNSLSELRRWAPALAAIQRAVSTYQRLASAPGIEAGKYEPELAASLAHLGRALRNLGRRQDALQATEQSEQIFRRLVDRVDDSATLNPGEARELRSRLALSLRSRGAILWELGERTGGLAATQQAVDMLRPLAEADPGAHEADLAMALNDLGVELATEDAPAAGVDSAREAADIGRRLVQVNPLAIRRSLVLWLANLVKWLTELNRLPEACAVMAEAVEAQRQLAPAEAPTYEDIFAGALDNLAISVTQDRSPLEGMALSGEAVDHWRRLTQSAPDEYEAGLARSLWIFAWARTIANAELSDAVSRAEEARAIYQKLVQQTPEDYQDALNSVTSVVGDLLVQLGRQPEADVVVPDLHVGPWVGPETLTPIESLEAVLKEAAGRADWAQRVRDSVASGDIYGLRRPAADTSASGEGAETDLLRFTSETEDDTETTWLPLFTNSTALRSALLRVPGWPQLSLIRLDGAELLAGLGRDEAAVINPWSDLEYEIPSRSAEAAAEVLLLEPASTLAEIDALLSQAAGQADWLERVRNAIAPEGIYTLGRTAGDTSVPGRGTESDLLHFEVADKDESPVTMLPVFTNVAAMREVLIRNPDWMELSVLKVNGGALLANVDDDVTVVINPWSDLEYQIPSRISLQGT